MICNINYGKIYPLLLNYNIHYWFISNSSRYHIHVCSIFDEVLDELAFFLTYWISLFHEWPILGDSQFLSVLICSWGFHYCVPKVSYDYYANTDICKSKINVILDLVVQHTLIGLHFILESTWEDILWKRDKATFMTKTRSN